MNEEMSIEQGKQELLTQVKALSKYLEPMDVENVARKTGLKPGTIRQIRKGGTFNMNAVLMLLSIGRTRRADYEKTIRAALSEDAA